MDLVRWCISHPVSVTVGVILVVMFGLIGVTSIPIQLAPNVDRTEIKVTTVWPGRSPEEVVDKITKEQEERLKSVKNLKSMRSISREGGSEITLEFYLDANINRALQEVSDSLRQVPEYPDDVDEPTIKAVTGAAENAIAWIIVDLSPEGLEKFPGFDITTLYDALDKQVKPFIERVDGVAEVNIYGGREREMQVLVDPTRLAQRGLTYGELMAALRAENDNISAGTLSEGKRDYRVRVVGQFQDEADIRNAVVAWRDGGPVYVKDVADVRLDYVKQRGFVRSLGEPAIAMNAIRQTNANVMKVMAKLRGTLDEVRADVLPRLDPEVGPYLRMRQVYDETVYITSAIDLVLNNLWVGGLLATAVLLLFLRSFVATGIIAIAIPISVVGTFLVLLALGRTLNVISLAGLAFATGMVVDNAIVVLENTFRHRQMGKPPMRAALDGGREVWGAMLASTLTTVAVFIPVLTVTEESGQLFRDISLAIVASVSLSLLVAITVIPPAAARWFGEYKPEHHHGRVRAAFQSLFGLAPAMERATRWFGRTLFWMMNEWRAWTIRPALLVVMMAVSLYGSWKLAPPLDYLPAGNRNLVFGGLLIPPGYSLDQMEQIAERIESQVRPYMEAGQDPSLASSLQPIPRRPIFDPKTGQPIPQEPFEPIPVENNFIGSFNNTMFTGATSTVPEKVLPIGQLLTNAMSTIPDSFGGAQQSSLFGRGPGGGSGNTINIEISGPNLARVKTAAAALFGSLAQAAQYGYQRVRPDPANFMLQQQETRVEVSRLGSELGLRTRDVGLAVQALFDGAYAGDYRTLGDTIDMRLLPKGGRLASRDLLASTPIATPTGQVVPVSSVVQITEGLAPQEIQRIEELPSVTLLVQPPQGMPLEAVMDDIRANHVQPLRDLGLIDPTMAINLAGTAAQLDEVKTALMGHPSTGGRAGWQRALNGVMTLFSVVGAGLATWGFVRAVRQKRTDFFYGALGIVATVVTVVGVAAMFVNGPHLVFARMIWALAVTYLLMCALYESFVFPVVIMFSVPLAIVGGFAALRAVHNWTMANPMINAQNLDVLTMLGFVILIGVVVNNAILIVHQALALMRGEADTQRGSHEALPPLSAIAEATYTRIRPIFMTATTSVLGMMPLVLFPGAGSELYRGLGAVVCGGMIVSTIFTLVVVPLALSIVVQMMQGLDALLGRESRIGARVHFDPMFGEEDHTPTRDHREPKPATEREVVSV